MWIHRDYHLNKPRSREPPKTASHPTHSHPPHPSITPPHHLPSHEDWKLSNQSRALIHASPTRPWDFPNDRAIVDDGDARKTLKKFLHILALAFNRCWDHVYIATVAVLHPPIKYRGCRQLLLQQKKTFVQLNNDDKSVGLLLIVGINFLNLDILWNLLHGTLPPKPIEPT